MAWRVGVRSCQTIAAGVEARSPLVKANMTISALVKKGRMDKAMSSLGWMKHNGIAPDVVTYTALVDGFQIGRAHV